jgi:hypothetical protein
MKRRRESPGLKWNKGVDPPQPYWVARQVVRDTHGYPDKTMRLPIDASEEELAALCRNYTSKLYLWIEQAQLGEEKLTRIKYDGTVLSLSRLYQEHPDSRFHEVRSNTRKFYTDSLKIIERTVGARAIRNLTIFSVKHWYNQWKKPTEPDGKERIDRAHDAVAMFRTILRFGAALRYDECKVLESELAMIKFDKGGSREQEMTYPYALAFVNKAKELATAGVMPEWRARSMAIGTAAQFELILRQKDIIGQWDRAKPNTPNATYHRGEMWTGFFVWENVHGWVWRLKTSKSNYKKRATFTLSNYSLLFPLLQEVPHAERTGSIVKGEHGLPMRERSYRRWFRQIARAADIPDEVWSMDSRAGGASEAEEAGAPTTAIQANLTHSGAATTRRYLRGDDERKIIQVAEARKRKREADEAQKDKTGDGKSRDENES